eukprot:scaffold5892_cov112-Isochrysis_galbana.AAC.24
MAAAMCGTTARLFPPTQLPTNSFPSGIPAAHASFTPRATTSPTCDASRRPTRDMGCPHPNRTLAALMCASPARLIYR